MARAALAIGAVLIAAGGGVLGYAWTRPPVAGLTPEASAAMASAVSQLDGEIRAARGAIHPIREVSRRYDACETSAIGAGL